MTYLLFICFVFNFNCFLLLFLFCLLFLHFFLLFLLFILFLLFLSFVLVPLFDHIKWRFHAELEVKSWILVDFIKCLHCKSLICLTNFVYEEIDLFVILRDHLLFVWTGNDRFRLVLLGSKFVHLLQNLNWFEISTILLFLIVTLLIVAILLLAAGL